MSGGTGPITVTFHRLAANEFREARRYYAQRSQSVADRFRDAVDEAVRQIATSPHTGSPFRSRYRWVRVRRFPYLLYYELLNPTEAMVLAVAHTQRRPGYWTRRTP